MIFAGCSVYLALVAILVPTLALPPLSVPDHVQHERRDIEGSQWAKRSRIDGAMLVPVRFGMTQSNVEKGDELLMQISDPASSRYGQHMSSDEVVDFFAPPRERIENVKLWLQSFPKLVDRPVTLSANKQWLQVDASISELEDLLNAQYHVYEHLSTGVTALGCDEYHVPYHLREHIDYITPGVKAVMFSQPLNQDIRGRSFSGGGRVQPTTKSVPITLFQNAAQSPNKECSSAVTPACIRTLYNITDTIEGHAGNSIGIYESEYTFYSQTDLNDYFSMFASNIPAGTHPKSSPVDGAPSPENSIPGTEADLDFQAAYPLVYPDKVVAYQVDDPYYERNPVSVSLNTFLDAIDGSYCNYSAFGETGDDPAIDPTYPDTHKGGYNSSLQCGRYVPANVISISYSEPEHFLPLNYLRRQCNEFMKLGLQGVSFIVSSGDSGVAPCTHNHTAFGANFPVNCPYITSAGATVLPSGAVAGKDPQIASTQFGSGGGFSNIYPRPKYQDRAVSFYFDNHAPPYEYYNTTLNRAIGPGRYNRAGRGFPDFACTGQNFAYFNLNQSMLAYGTSVSAPLFASMIARINSARLTAGKKTLGFLNPTFYQNPDIFDDIVTGDNPGCKTKGFSCVPGWDPVTGLGTPNYGKMKDLFMSLP